MPELTIGLLVGLALAVQGGLDPAGALTAGVFAALALYMASCWIWPYRRCSVCGGRTEVGDSRGNYRHRWSTCWWCRGSSHNRRLGARLMRRG